ncbi:MAG: hypothetical protein ACYTDT_08210 [Planctomycetota bacterium]|jgi:hypothetical protein
MKFDNNTEYEPATGVRKVVGKMFAGTLILLFAFAITMAAWGDLREALMIRFNDDKVRQSIVIEIEAKTHVWMGDVYLKKSEVPNLGKDNPDSDIQIEYVHASKPRTYLEGVQFSEAGITPPDGFNMAPWKSLFPDAKVLHQGRKGPDLRWAAIETKHEQLDWMGLIRLPKAGPEPERVYLLRFEKLGRRAIKSLSLEVHSDQLRIEDDSFWTERIEKEGLPESMDGQIRISWVLHVEMYESDKDAREDLPASASDLGWVGLLSKEEK